METLCSILEKSCETSYYTVINLCHLAYFAQNEAVYRYNSFRTFTLMYFIIILRILKYLYIAAINIKAAIYKYTLMFHEATAFLPEAFYRNTTGGFISSNLAMGLFFVKLTDSDLKIKLMPPQKCSFLNNSV